MKPHHIVWDLKWLRRNLNMTQVGLGARIGYDRVWLSNRESGRVSPTLAELKDWAEGLGCEVRVELVEVSRRRIGYDEHGAAFPLP